MDDDYMTTISLFVLKTAFLVTLCYWCVVGVNMSNDQDDKNSVAAAMNSAKTD